MTKYPQRDEKESILMKQEKKANENEALTQERKISWKFIFDTEMKISIEGWEGKMGAQTGES